MPLEKSSQTSAKKTGRQTGSLLLSAELAEAQKVMDICYSPCMYAVVKAFCEHIERKDIIASQTTEKLRRIREIICSVYTEEMQQRHTTKMTVQADLIGYSLHSKNKDQIVYIKTANTDLYFNRGRTAIGMGSGLIRMCNTDEQTNYESEEESDPEEKENDSMEEDEG